MLGGKLEKCGDFVQSELDVLIEEDVDGFWRLEYIFQSIDEYRVLTCQWWEAHDLARWKGMSFEKDSSSCK